MKETARQIRIHRLAKAKRQPNRAELEKALSLCLTCLDDIKPAIDIAHINAYIDATMTAANAIVTRS